MTRATSQKYSKAPQAVKLTEEIRVAANNIRKAIVAGKPLSAGDVEILRGSAEALIELGEG
jgi:hypothetical protein